jgi:hypothetical protein
MVFEVCRIQTKESAKRLKRCSGTADRTRQWSDGAMEIGPIPGIRALGAVSARRADWQGPAVFDIDGSAKPGDGNVQTAAKKAAGAEEDAEDKLVEDENEPQKSVDCFA